MLGQPAAAAHLAGVLAFSVPLFLLSAASAFCFWYCCSVSSALRLEGSAYDTCTPQLGCYQTQSSLQMHPDSLI